MPQVGRFFTFDAKEEQIALLASVKVESSDPHKQPGSHFDAGSLQ